MSPGRVPLPGMLLLILVEFGITFFLAQVVIEEGRYRISAYALGPQGAIVGALAAASLVCLTSLAMGTCRPRLLTCTGAMVVSTVLAGALALSATWGFGALSHIRLPTLSTPDAVWPGAVWPGQAVLGWVVALLAVRLAFGAAWRGRMPPHHVALPASLGDASETLAAIQACQLRRFEVVTPPGPDASPDSMCAAGVNTLLLPAATLCQANRADFAARGIELLSLPAFWERHLGRVDLAGLQPAWFAHLDTDPRSRLHRAATRTADIVASLALLALLIPLMVLVAILIWLDDPGPVFYRQERMGVGGRSFVLLKFRSMRNHAETRGPVWAQRRDPRITRVGAILRRSRIDELPQLLNVLRGEMRFIGPRPERPHFVEQLAAVIPFYRERMCVQPGLTGWAQVNFPYAASVDDARAKLSYDLFYIKNRGPMLDLRILLATVRVILFQEGAR